MLNFLNVGKFLDDLNAGGEYGTFIIHKFHMKSRIYHFLEKPNEALKTYQDWLTWYDKMELREFDFFKDCYLPGFLHQKTGNLKEAEKWYKKALNTDKEFPDFGLDPDDDFTVESYQADTIYMCYSRIGQVRYLQGDFKMSFLILTDFCTTYDNHKEILTEEEQYYQSEDSWKKHTGMMTDHYNKAKEILEHISKWLAETPVQIEFKQIVSCLLKSEKNQESEFEACKKEIDRMARKISKNLIKYVEEELEEEDGKFETIVSFEKTVKKVLELRLPREDAYHEVSKVLDQIQLGKFHVLTIKVVTSQSFYLLLLFLDLTKEDWCLEVLFHMKTRVLILFDKKSEAIKVLKKLKKTNREFLDEVLLNYLIGFVYEQSTNYKEALIWYKKVLNVSKTAEFSLDCPDATEVYTALFAMSNIKFNHFKEYGMAKIMLDEFCSAYNDHKDMFYDEEYFLRNSWVPIIGTMENKFNQAQEILSKKIKEPGAGVAVSDFDLMEIVKFLKSHRKSFNDNHDAHEAKHLMHIGEHEHALIHFQTHFEGMNLVKDPKLLKPEDDDFSKFIENHEEYCECLFRFSMLDEAYFTPAKGYMLNVTFIAN